MHFIMIAFLVIIGFSAHFVADGLTKPASLLIKYFIYALTVIRMMIYRSNVASFCAMLTNNYIIFVKIVIFSIKSTNPVILVN